MIKRPLFIPSLSLSLSLINNTRSLSRWIDLEKPWVVVGYGWALDMGFQISEENSLSSLELTANLNINYW